MADIVKVIELPDGTLTNGVDKYTGLSINYKPVTTWYDGSAMDTSKVDDDLYTRKGSKFYRKVIDKDGELLLEKDTMVELRALSAREILYLKAGVYRGVKLNGYYEAGDTPASIDYYLSDTNEADNSFNIIEVGSIKLETYFKDNVVHASYAGVKSDSGEDMTAQLKRVIDYFNVAKTGKLTTPSGRIKVSKETDGTLYFLNNLKNFELDCSSTIFYVDDLNDFINASYSYSLVSGKHVITVTTLVNHNALVGQLMCFKSANDRVYSGYYVVTEVVSPTVFKYEVPYVPTSPSDIGSFRIRSISKRFISFVDCEDVNLNTVNFEGTVQPQNIQARLGWTFIRTSGGKNIKGELNVKGAVYGFLSGESGLDNGNTSNLNIKINATDVGYPFYVAKSGKDSYFEVHGERFHRGGYIVGTENFKARLFIKNYDITGCLIGFQQVGSTLVGQENIDVKVVDTGSDERPSMGNPLSASRWMVGLSGYFVDYPAEMSNINVELHSKGAKYTNGIIGQTYSTENKLKNITVSGSIDNSTLLPEECGVEYNFGSEQEQYAGVYEGIKVSLNVKQPLGFTQQPRIVCRKLLDNILFDNYKSNSTPLINIPKSIEYSVKSTNSESLEDTLLKIRASKSRAITASTLTLNPLSNPIGTDPYSVTMLCNIPLTGNFSLFNNGTSLSSVVSNSHRLYVNSGNLVYRIYGATTSIFQDYIVNNFQSDYGGKPCFIAVIKNETSILIFINGLNVLTSPLPSFDTNILGLNLLFGGVTTSETSYTGKLSQFNIFNYDVSSDINRMMLEDNTTDADIVGSSILMSSTVNNGGFETLGAPTFQGWLETKNGTSTITSNSDSHTGSYACQMQSDSSGSLVDISQTGIIPIGGKYRIELYAKTNQAGSSITVDGFQTLQSQVVVLTTTYQKHTFTGVGNSVVGRFTIRRTNLPNNVYALIDDVTIKKLGVISRNEFNIATTATKGLVNQSAKVDNVATANATTDTPSTATDVAGLLSDFNDLVEKFNALVALSNENKSVLNSKLGADRTSGQQAP